eukprot:CAMPEP_0204604646 /NCGR_PEP_ID=MMETSP0661-20131031/58000_1 /ASSEMBLY_ACC=CAM_ASM_000606 /TAXON_ID=109239 /ORGANISM="Alexandrium margalefi, Strain AMGDE01CS-322" /LENGTH=166 /DNA_ID=CAMNT_0051615825 /DNA_START=178 /DNA_END=678 /DNA_ORIENTATION=-
MRCNDAAANGVDNEVRDTAELPKLLGQLVMMVHVALVGHDNAGMLQSRPPQRQLLRSDMSPPVCEHDQDREPVQICPEEPHAPAWLDHKEHRSYDAKHDERMGNHDRKVLLDPRPRLDVMELKARRDRAEQRQVPGHKVEADVRGRRNQIMVVVGGHQHQGRLPAG